MLKTIAVIGYSGLQVDKAVGMVLANAATQQHGCQQKPDKALVQEGRIH